MNSQKGWKLLLSVAILVSWQKTSYSQENAEPFKWAGNGLKIELAPLGLDQARAFLIGREFSSVDADFVARTGCIFRSAIGNSGSLATDPAIRLELGKWRILRNGQVAGLRTREEWAGILEARGVAETPRIAFHWALFPTVQDHQPTDYNWGLVSFAMPPGTVFDLELNWTLAGKEQRHRLINLECAK